ncbi:Associated molecule with the SH3 domain ofAM 1 isoform 3 [Populus alba x Populus x berolinensis]|nr:Associated molecule with the SH3 domain ofAM 1 isoform 3 [Populus alba x Populus x berolinensis]
MKSSSSSCIDIINIEARTQRLDVDNRFALNIYIRIANHILKTEPDNIHMLGRPDGTSRFRRTWPELSNDQMRRLSLGILYWVRTGLMERGNHQGLNEGVKYPSIIDSTPVEIPRLQESVKAELFVKSEHSSSEPGRSSLESILSVQDDNQKCRDEEPCSLISFETMETPVLPAVIRQPSPPPSTTLMENFMKMAKSNTDKNLETCGVLAGSLKNRKFYVTALIIPKQESTSDSVWQFHHGLSSAIAYCFCYYISLTVVECITFNQCQTTNEEEIFEVQDKRSLFPLGWIHTHPTQSCFMSSIDVHTHYSYQIMLPEAVAIVMAPRDSSRTHGIFRLTTPGGMSVIRQCQHRGFHPHDPPSDGGPIYKSCTDVYMNPNLKFDVIDLR